MSARFTLERDVSVRPPYRLDLTVDALRRLPANVVDVVDANGTYRRALEDAAGVNVIEATQPHETLVRVRITGRAPERWLPIAEKMLGVHADVRDWEKRAARFPWLAFLARELRGLRAPRYPSLWEALAHAIVFQQISIHAAGAIMRRLVETLGTPARAGAQQSFAFVAPERLLCAPDEMLRGAGLSANKVAHLRSAAHAVCEQTITAHEIEALDSPGAAARLGSIRGIGPWSAAVVLLRGFGRLDVFPMNDSGVARSIKLLSGDPGVDAAAVLDALGPVRGMLYFHLLLGRVRNLVAADGDSST